MSNSSSATETRCYKHYCRLCHTMEFVPVAAGAMAPHPFCCGKITAYLGVVDAVPGKDTTLKITAPR